MANRVTIEALANWLKDKDDVVLLGHESPDGDAAGSCRPAFRNDGSPANRVISNGFRVLCTAGLQ